MPLYNKSPYVGRALNSVLSQTHAEFKLIVVDDGSTDDSCAIVEAIPDERIMLVHQINQGVSAARNNGTSKAVTDWIAFLDADDEWTPDFLEKLLRVAAASPALVAVGSNYKNSLTGRPAVTNYKNRNYFAESVSNRANLFSASSTMVRRDVLTRLGGFPVGVRFGEDIDTFARLAWTGDIGYVDEPLATYHWVADSAMRKPVKEMIAFPVIAATFEQWHRDGRIPKQLLASSRRYVAKAVLAYIQRLIEDGDQKLARQLLLSQAKWGLYRFPKWMLCTFRACARRKGR